MAPVTASKRTVTPGWAWAVAGLCVLLLAPLVSQRGKLMPRATPLQAASGTATTALSDNDASPSGVKVATGTHHGRARPGVASSAPAPSPAGPTSNASRLLHEHRVAVAPVAKLSPVAVDRFTALGARRAPVTERAGAVRVAWPGPVASATPGAERARSEPTVGPTDHQSGSQAGQSPAPTYVPGRSLDLGPARRVRFRSPRLYWGAVNTGRGPQPQVPDPEQGQNG